MRGWWVTSTWRLMVLHLRLVLKEECSRVIILSQFSVLCLPIDYEDMAVLPLEPAPGCPLLPVEGGHGEVEEGVEGGLFPAE